MSVITLNILQNQSTINLKIYKMRYLISTLLLSLLIFSCSKNSREDAIIPEEGTPDQSPVEGINYTIYNFEHFLSSGQVQILKDKKDAFYIQVELDNEFDQLDLAIYSGSMADENTEKVITLEPITSDDSKSISKIVQTDNGEEISFEDFLSMDIHLKIMNEDRFIYFAELGNNGLTSVSKKYTLLHDTNRDISFDYTFFERNNGYTFGCFKMTGSHTGSSILPVEIRSGNYANNTSRTLIELFDYPANEKNFIKYTSFSETIFGDDFTYQELMNNDYHTIVVQPMPKYENMYAVVDLGTSEKTDEFTSGEYLDTVNSYTFGTFDIIKRNDGTAVIKSSIKRSSSTIKYLFLELYNENDGSNIQLGKVEISSASVRHTENNIKTESVSLTYETIINGNYTYQLVDSNGELVAAGKL